MPRQDIIQRAFELARTGAFATPTGVGRALQKEGYFGVQPLLAGLGFRRELKELIKDQRA